MSVRSPGRRLRWPVPGAAAIRSAWTMDDVRALIGGTVVVGLVVLWSADNGGYGSGTWLWGGLVVLAALALTLATGRRPLASVPRPVRIAIVAFAAYVGWSFLSMTWAANAGLALQGSDRALLYLLAFALLAILPWRRATALVAVLAYATGVGVIAIVYLLRFAAGSHVPGLFDSGRLVEPTGYFNATAALYTTGALVAISLSARRFLPGVARGLMLAFASAELMLAIAVQSRGWLFTLPIVGLYAVLVIGSRLRTIGMAIVPAAGALVVARPMLRLYHDLRSGPLTHAAIHAGKLGLLVCAGVFAVGTLVAWIQQARRRRPLSGRVAGALGIVVATGLLAAVAGGLLVVSNGHPTHFVSREWHGFTVQPTTNGTASHFNQVGTGRYQIWRTALQAFRAHPIEGLGQDNFGDYYLVHRTDYQEPLWTHSLELRLLVHTGIVGAALFLAFLVAALLAAGVARRRGELPDRMLVGAALLPLGVWLIHGSIDWFWEFPALSVPALGFLALAGRLGASPAAPSETTVAEADSTASRRLVAWSSGAIGVAALAAATVVLGLPYLSLVYSDRGETASYHSVSASLADFRTAHRLDPLASDPADLAGTVALVNGLPVVASDWFTEAVSRRPGDWYAYLGRGLAAQQRGQIVAARDDFRAAARIDGRQLAVQQALAQVGTRHPLGVTAALNEIEIA